MQLRSEIGLNELASSGGLPFFGIMMILLIFHVVGMYENLSDALNNRRIARCTFRASF
jgi:hypothetical protein